MIKAEPTVKKEPQEEEEPGEKEELPKRREPKKKRRAKLNRLRLKEARATSGELDPDHNTAHWPPSDHCEFCVNAKQRKKAAARLPKEDAEAARSSVPRRKNHFDLGVCRKPDVHGKRYVACGKDDYSGYRYVGWMRSKTADETWETTEQLFPGSCLSTPEQDPEADFPFEFSVDGGNEFCGTFERKVKERGSRTRVGQPGRSEDNASAEKNVGDIERDTAVAMQCSNVPYEFCSYASIHQVFNVNRQREVRDTGKSAYELHRGRAYDGRLFPFACECMFVSPEDERDKMESRSRRGVILGYGDRRGELMKAQAILSSSGEELFEGIAWDTPIAKGYPVP